MAIRNPPSPSLFIEAKKSAFVRCPQSEGRLGDALQAERPETHVSEDKDADALQDDEVRCPVMVRDHVAHLLAINPTP